MFFVSKGQETGMAKTKKAKVREKEAAPPDAREYLEQEYEKIVSFLLNRYIKERDEDK